MCYCAHPLIKVRLPPLRRGGLGRGDLRVVAAHLAEYLRDGVNNQPCTATATKAILPALCATRPQALKNISGNSSVPLLALHPSCFWPSTVLTYTLRFCTCSLKTRHLHLVLAVSRRPWLRRLISTLSLHLALPVRAAGAYIRKHNVAPRTITHRCAKPTGGILSIYGESRWF